jgi:hypothetical protein
MKTYIRRCPDRAPWGTNKAAVLALAPGESITAPTMRRARILANTARFLGVRLVQRALHPYSRQQPGQPPPQRCFQLTRV